MGCCSAVNCKNRTEIGFKMYRFPKDPHEKNIWVHMRRVHCIPSSSSRMCERHFENSQFEHHRADGKIKLKANTVPTLFDVPNPPSQQQDVEQLDKQTNANRKNDAASGSNNLAFESSCRL